MKKTRVIIFFLVILTGCGYNPFKGIEVDEVVDISLIIKNFITKDEKMYRFEKDDINFILDELKKSKRISFNECIKESSPIEFHLFLKTKANEYKIEITNSMDFFWIEREDRPIPFRYKKLREVLDNLKKIK